MPRRVTPLTAIAVKQAKSREKEYCLFDGNGGFLQITKTGSKIWRIKYRLNGRERRCTLGHYPEMTLQDFRIAVLNFKKNIAAGVDLVKKRADEKKAEQQTVFNEKNTFNAVAIEWFNSQKRDSGMSDSGLYDIQKEMRLYLFPFFGKKPITEITRRDAVDIVKQIEALGRYAVLKKVVSVARQIFSYAVTCEYVLSNPFGELRSIIKKTPPSKHYSTFTDPIKIGELMRRIYAYKTPYNIVKAQTLFLIFTLSRKSEARKAEWAEFDFGKKTWVVPALKMKARKEHIVPLNDGALEALHLSRESSLFSSPYVFSSNLKSRPVSMNACCMFLKLLGYSGDEIVPHGFRAMGSTALNELGWPRDWVDVALSHSIGSTVSQAYNHALYLEGRRCMMKAWYEYLIALRDGMTPDEAKKTFSYLHYFH